MGETNTHSRQLFLVDLHQTVCLRANDTHKILDRTVADTIETELFLQRKMLDRDRSIRGWATTDFNRFAQSGVSDQKFVLNIRIDQTFEQFLQWFRYFSFDGRSGSGQCFGCIIELLEVSQLQTKTDLLNQRSIDTDRSLTLSRPFPVTQNLRRDFSSLVIFFHRAARRARPPIDRHIGKEIEAHLKDGITCRCFKQHQHLAIQ